MLSIIFGHKENMKKIKITVLLSKFSDVYIEVDILTTK